MLSLPDSEDERAPVDENAPLENKEFQTPPEEHHLSSSSSQEDPQRSLNRLAAVAVEVCMERATAADGNGGNEPGVENLGFPGSKETGAGENGVLGTNVLEINDDVAGELKEFEVSESESEEPALKKIRVSKENWDSVRHTLHMEGTQITEKVDNEDDKLINLDPEEGDEEIGPNEDKTLIDVDSAEEESKDNDDVINDVGKEFPDANNNREFEVGNIAGSGSHGNVNNRREEKECINLDNGEKSLSRKRSGDLAGEESEEGLRNNSGGKLRRCDKEVLNCMNREDIDAFKYNGGGGDNGDHRWKEVVRRRRELPLSMRDKGSDRGGKWDNGNVDVKNLSWKELLDALTVLLKVDRGNEGDADFLETAKSKGLTFPQPRWI